MDHPAPRAARSRRANSSARAYLTKQRGRRAIHFRRIAISPDVSSPTRTPPAPRSRFQLFNARCWIDLRARPVVYAASYVANGPDRSRTSHNTCACRVGGGARKRARHVSRTCSAAIVCAFQIRSIDHAECNCASWRPGHSFREPAELGGFQIKLETDPRNWLSVIFNEPFCWRGYFYSRIR